MHSFLFDLSTVLPSFMLSVAMGQALSLSYELSYEGLSFSRRFVNGLSLITLSATALMLALASHYALGLGLIGSMAMLRFRVNTRDLWEMSFVFAALVSGLACGLRLYAITCIFTMLFCVVAYLLSKGKVGAQFRFDGVLRFWLPYTTGSETNASSPQLALEQVLRTYCSSYQLISMREGSQGEGSEMSYHVTLKGRRQSVKKEHNRASLFTELKTQFGVEELSLLSQDHHLEL